ncbi:MAG: diguanylate cyclase [Desulfocapsaceae bacterium]|nr:diguanylate cyclase [Desulfocapsaceae bacterium]
MNKSEKILVVDDDMNLRKTLSDILRVKGYETAIAGTGAEAITATKQGDISLALIDLMLPDMSGLEVMKHIKEISPLTEAIILTGHASMDTAIKATGQGAFSYLLKPYNMDDLLRIIGHGVERQQAKEEILRLASFPRLHPCPVIELDSEVDISYLNPAAERVFPELGAMGKLHPLLHSSVELLKALRQNKEQGETIHEVEVGAATYELHISYVQDVDLIRIYVADITQRKRDEEAIYLLATTDSLTGISNRREFTSIMGREMEQAKRYGTPMALVMYDLDYFKRVNDTFGHDVGDYVLRAVTELVKENIRATDIVARWGGEEFMVLMPQSDIESARNTAEKLRLAIAGHHFDKVNKLTTSFGVIAFEPQDDLNSLLKRVDDALYQAKKQGRNRVEVLRGEVASC